MPPLTRSTVPWTKMFRTASATLYLGDCREVLPTLKTGSLYCIVTDPPYGHNNNNNGDLIHRREAALGRGERGEARSIANDGTEANDLFRRSLPEWLRVLVPGACCCCCCGGGGPDPQFARWSLWLDEVFDLKQMVVWDKGPMGMGWHYRRSYETVLVAQKPGANCRWFDETNAIENIVRPGYKGIRKIIPLAEQHPTEKPVELMRHFIELHTRPGESVLDPFMGSGTTGVAALESGRTFIGVECDPAWYDVACRRVTAADPVFTQAQLF